MHSETPGAPGVEEVRAGSLPAARLLAAGEEQSGRLPATQFALGVLGGAWLSFGVNLLLIATTDCRLGTGPGQLLAGLALALGPLLVLLAGGELFCARPLPVMAWLAGRVSFGAMLRGGAATWAGNLVGGVAMALLVHLSAQYLLGGSAVGTAMVTAAAQKCRLPFGVALLRGVLGGALVSLAGWLAVRATTVTEKAAATLPFVALAAGGFEYAAINAHLVPLGLLTEGAVGFVDPSLGLLEFVWGNLVPVTIGNGMGAVVTAGLVYWALYGASRGGQGRTGRGALGGERRRRTVPPGRADD